MKKKSFFLLILTVVLVLSASIQSAMGYFTTYAEARGGYLIELGGDIEIEEEFSRWTKHVQIVSTPGAEPVWVRAKAFCGDAYTLIYDGGDDWVLGADGYYYYQEILYGGSKTPVLDIRIRDIPEDVEVGDNFNVVVIYEYVPVQFDRNGNPLPADWD